MLGIGLGPSSCDPLDLERCLGEEERSYYSREVCILLHFLFCR